MTHEVERIVRVMTRTERAIYLRERGWTRLGYSGAQSWLSPYGDRGHWTLAAAIRREISGQAPPGMSNEKE